MGEDKKDYFVPEQLDDNDFEKEKIEDKKKRKESRFEFNKKKIIKLFSILLVIILICIGIYLYLNPVEKKSSAPEQFTKDFCAYFNSGNWTKINNMMDFKAYYVLNTELEEKDYPKFDKKYKTLDEESEKYKQFSEKIYTLLNVDQSVLDELSGTVQIKLNSIEACNLIQGTDTLYKLRVNFDYIYNGESENTTDIIYVSNASGEYKMVYGEWLKTVLSFYNTVYVYQTNYGN